MSSAPSDVFNRPAPQTIDLLLSRRSGSAKALTGPGPDAEELGTILRAAARVPDHAARRRWLRTHAAELHAALDAEG